VSQVLDSANDVVQETEPQVVRHVISAGTSDKLRSMLNAVVSPEGTGSHVVIDGYNIGGKTGTAQQITNKSYEEGKVTLTFMAYLPVEAPQYIVLTVVDKPDQSTQNSASAAGMMREVLQGIIKYKNIQPSNGASEVAADPDTMPMPDYVGAELRDASQDLNSLGLGFSCSGDGDQIVSQFPAAGERVTPGSQVILYLKSSGAELAVVPDVSKLSPEEAIQAIYDAGLSAATVYMDSGTGQESPATVETPPASETAVASETTSAGASVPPEEAATPDVAGTSLAGPAWKVEQQMPQPGAKVQKGTEVKLIIS
jgi:stage V sporulation protein D (sporulation-specific penicillin-binding protein)